MSAHFNLKMSDDLNRDLDRIAAESKNSKSEVMRKALILYLTAIDGNRRGLTLGLVDQETGKLHTAIVGL